MYTRDELSTFTLQKLASLYPQTEPEEVLLQEVFEQRASVSNYFTLTSLVDVKNGWQEKIIQKYVDIKRETMALENPATLLPEDEAALDTNVITKEKELELQAKLDKKNGRYKEPVLEEPTVEEAPEQIPVAEDASVTPEEVVEVPVKKAKKKK